MIGFGLAVIGERACAEGFSAVLLGERIAVIGFGVAKIGERACSGGFVEI